MTRRPARQPHPAAAPRVDDPASRPGGWIDAPAQNARPDHLPGYESLLAATDASERRAIETASRTAAALGSVASWIERAQEQLTESTRAAARSQDQTATVLQDAVGTLGERLSRIESKVGDETSAVASALQAIERIETRLSERGETAPTRLPPRLDDTLRSFDSRLEELNGRIVASPRPIGRRGLAVDAEVLSAVAEIRSHQAMLDGQAQGGMPHPTLPALGTLARSQTAILTTMRADIAKLSTKLDTAAIPPGGELTHEVETLRDSLGGLATRTDLDRLEKSIRSLTSDIADLRTVDRGASTSHEMATLQAEIRRLADARNEAGPAHDPSGLEVLSHKLDILAASGVDPAVVSSLACQVDDVRQLLAGAAAPQALSLVSAHLDALRREVAAVGGRQLHPDAFASIQATLNDIRTSLTTLGPARPEGSDVARAMRDFGQPIETMLASLAEKVERVDRRISDPAALDGLQHQLADMAGRIGGQGRDPAVAALERSMGELLREVAGWRDGAVEMAERAARAAVAETIGSKPVVQEVEQHLLAIRDHYTATEARTTESLASVHEALETVMRRMASLEGHGSGRSASAGDDVLGATRGGATRPAGAPDRRVSGKADRRQAPSASGLDRGGQPAAEADEILLEPGAARPRLSAATTEHADGGDPPALASDDVRSHFIAAARRAAQAAQSEAAGSRRKDAKASAQQPRASSRLSPAEIVRKLRAMIDAKRRPLLLSAAALVLALGTLQIARNLMAEAPVPPQDSPGQRTVRIQPPPAPLPLPTATRDPAPTATPERVPPRSFSDPLTTQSIGDRVPSRPDERPGTAPNHDDARRAPPATSALPTAEKEAVRVADAPAAAPPTLPVPPSLARGAIPSEPTPALPPNIRQAALAGNPVALFDLAARTADGRGVARDTKAALGLFEKAAEKGFAPAQYRIGNIYERGLGVPRDLDQAKTWYRRAAEGGNVRAMHNLAVLTAEGGAGPADYAQAVGWFTKAANFGVRDSQFNLAVLHARGLGTPQDLAKSYLWLALAAAQGDEDAGRKRDEVGARLTASDLVRTKAEVARWHAETPNPAANEVQVPAEGFPDAPVKRASRDTRTY